MCASHVCCNSCSFHGLYILGTPCIALISHCIIPCPVPTRKKRNLCRAVQTGIWHCARIVSEKLETELQEARELSPDEAVTVGVYATKLPHQLLAIETVEVEDLDVLHHLFDLQLSISWNIHTQKEKILSFPACSLKIATSLNLEWDFKTTPEVRPP